MDWDFGDILLAMLAFYFWFMFISMFIRVFGDIFRRTDLSGAAKAGWLLLIVLLPFLGILLYMVSRPPLTAEEVRMTEGASQVHRTSLRHSAADEVAKLAELRDNGTLSEEEFQRLKAKVLA
jgi:hypothetical protein